MKVRVSPYVQMEPSNKMKCVLHVHLTVVPVQDQEVNVKLAVKML